MINAFELIKKLNELELSAEEFCFAYFVHLTKEKQHEHNTLFGIYYEINKNKHNYSKIINSLETKGYIENMNNDNEFKLNKLIITDKFKKTLIIDIDKAWIQVINEYPLKLNLSNGSVAMLHGSKINLKQYYYEKIIKGGDKALHHEFLALTNYYYGGEKTVNEGCGLEKYLVSWDSFKLLILDELKQGEKASNRIVIN